MVTRLLAVCCLFSFMLCSCSEKSSDNRVVVRINEYEITAREFETLFQEALMTQDTPAARQAFLDTLITRKLMLQEAQRRGLDRGDDFLKDIERFWEQSLLKIMVDVQTREILSSMTVTDAEIEEAYEKWVGENPDSSMLLGDVRELIGEQILKQKQSLTFNAWLQALREKADVVIDTEAVGVE